MASNDEYQQRQFFDIKFDKKESVLKSFIDITNDAIEMKDVVWTQEKHEGWIYKLIKN